MTAIPSTIHRICNLRKKKLSPKLLRAFIDEASNTNTIPMRDRTTAIPISTHEIECFLCFMGTNTRLELITFFLKILPQTVTW